MVHGGFVWIIDAAAGYWQVEITEKVFFRGLAQPLPQKKHP